MTSPSPLVEFPLYIAFTSHQELNCCFYTLVFRVDALDEKYPGGTRVFLETHQGWCNQDIMAVFHFGDARKRVLADIDRYRLLEDLDYVKLDEDTAVWSWDRCFFDHQGVSWLRARYREGDVLVRFVEGEILK